MKKILKALLVCLFIFSVIGCKQNENIENKQTETPEEVINEEEEKEEVPIPFYDYRFESDGSCTIYAKFNSQINDDIFYMPEGAQTSEETIYLGKTNVKETIVVFNVGNSKLEAGKNLVLRYKDGDTGEEADLVVYVQDLDKSKTTYEGNRNDSDHNLTNSIIKVEDALKQKEENPFISFEFIANKIEHVSFDYEFNANGDCHFKLVEKTTANRNIEIFNAPEADILMINKRTNKDGENTIEFDVTAKDLEKIDLIALNIGISDDDRDFVFINTADLKNK